MVLVTGEVGSGKSTALRFAMSRLHPSEYRLLWVTATGGSILELYRQIALEMEVETASFSRAVLTRTIRKSILELAFGKKQKVVLLIDEASLLRLEVFAELHTLMQFEGDSKPLLPMVLAGQNICSINSIGELPSPIFPGHRPKSPEGSRPARHGGLPEPSPENRRAGSLGF